MKKKVLSLLLILTMVLSILPASVFAVDRDLTKNQVRVIVSNDTYSTEDGAPWVGTLVDTWVDINSNSTMMNCVVDALGSYPITGAESGYITEINGISAAISTCMEGWMGTLNDWFTNEGFDAFTVANGKLVSGDVIHIVYSCDMGEDCGGSCNNNDKTIKAIEFSTGSLNTAFDKDTKSYTLTVPAGTSEVIVTPTASNKNFQVRASVGTTEYKRNAAIPVQNGTVISVKCGDPSWPSMNNSPYGTADTVDAETYTFTVAVEAAGYLSELAFGSASAAANKGNFVLSPAFDANIHEYTISVPDTVMNVYAWAKLSEAGTGKTIKANYKTSTSADKSITLTSAKTTGANLTSALIKGTFCNDITITVGDQEYLVHIKRNATLSELSFINGDSVEVLNGTFDPATTNYTMTMADASSLKAVATKSYDGAVVTTGGVDLGESFALSWNAEGKATIIIEVSYGTEASKTVYTVTASKAPFEGLGSESSPFIINNINDFITLRDLVNSGNAFKDKYFLLKSDITLPAGWTPVGDLTETAKTKYTDYTTTVKVKDSTPFSGIFDGGGHTITVPEGELTAFGSVFHATLKNFNIYGTKIPGYGVVQYWLQRSSSNAKDNNLVTIENVKLLSGTHTMMSGFLGGYESGQDRIVIRNCVVEEGVVLGNDGKGFWTDYETTEAINNAYAYGPSAPIYQNDFVGSFVGAGSGEIINCKSSATVYGNNYVGGIWGFKGQSMGDCLIRECSFDGEVIANGNYVGGILGSGYASTSAPNTPCATVQNCVSYATVSGIDYVGGIFGGEILLKQNWNNGVGYIQNNFFGGNINCQGTTKGAIIGYFNVLDNCNVISNNYYLSGCGADKGMILNKVETTNNQYVPAYSIAAGDDPEFFCKAVQSEADALAGLNSGANSSTTWKMEGGKLVCGTDKHVVSIYSENLNNNPPITLSSYTALDEEALTVTYNDGTTENIKVSDCAKGDWDFSEEGCRAVQLKYKNAQCVFLLKNTAVISVPSVNHYSLIKTEGVLSTCTESGISEYWTCLGCGKYFSDSDGLNEIEKDAWILELASHADTDFNGICDDCHAEIDTVKTANVDYTSQYGGAFLHAPKSAVSVSSNLAELYGFEDGVSYLEGVSVLDVLVQAHIDVYGDAFTKDTAGTYLTMSSGSPSMQFGIDSTIAYGGFFLNHGYPNDGTESSFGGYNGTLVATQKVADNDLVEFFFYEDEYYGDTYNWFTGESGYARYFNVSAKSPLELTLKGFGAMSAYLYKDASEMIASQSAGSIEDVQIYLVNKDTGALTAIKNAVTDENGKVSLTFDNEGTYTVAAYGTDDCTFKQLLSLTTIEVGKHVHTLTKTDASAASCTAAGNDEYWTCSECGKYFSDADGNTEVTENSWLISANGHTLTKTDAKAASCTAAGSSAYWTCSVCGKYFSDADGKTEVQKDSWVIQAAGHKDSNSDSKCDVCGADLSAPAADNDITVYYTVLGDELHGDDGSVHTLMHGGLTTWVAKRSVKVSKNATVWDVMVKAASDLGGTISYSNSSGNYVSSITYAGESLGEFDNGTLSGWMYTLNGTHPGYGVGEQKVSAGDVIVFHYTDDYTQEEGSEKWDEPYDPGTSSSSSSSGKTTEEITSTVAIKTDASVDGKSEINVTSIELENIVSSGAVVEVQTPNGNVEMPNDALGEIVKQAGDEKLEVVVETKKPDDVKDIIKKNAPEALKNAPVKADGIKFDEKLLDSAAVVDVKLSAGNKTVTSFGGKEIVISVPADAKKFAEGKYYRTFIVSGDNTVEATSAKIVNGKAKVKSAHLSTFVVTEEECTPFIDVALADWFAESASKAFEKGVINGVGNNVFDAKGTFTRAMVVQVLWNLEGKPVVNYAMSFTDVAAGSWYEEAVRWAQSTGIIGGYPDGRFDPEGAVTREQTALILKNYAGYKKLDVTKLNDIAGFKDAADVSSWALDAVKWANAMEIIKGSDNKLNPTGDSSRAEAAAMLVRFIEKLMK